VWIPYLQRIEKVRGAWRVTYNGGEFELKPAQADSVMFYGATGDLPLAFLDDLATHRVPMLLHRRNLADPYVFVPSMRRDDADLLSAQVRARQDERRCAYIARQLVRARFQAVAKTCPFPQSRYAQLAACRNVDQVRHVEASLSARYWRAYLTACGQPDQDRRSKGPVQSALDAGSFFLYGILLRWLLVHRLSPAHGYLHETTSYPSLAYDLMEPFRYLIEEAAMKWAVAGATDLTAATLAELKQSLDLPVYVPATRQRVRTKNLLHGVVLALRAYLLGDMIRFVVPAAGAKGGGRPLKVSYRLPGEIWETKRKGPV
jgi:CRISPR-associated endonuclease Cas1